MNIIVMPHDVLVTFTANKQHSNPEHSNTKCALKTFPVSELRARVVQGNRGQKDETP